MDQPITLYLDLEPGTKADLVAVARAAIAFEAAVRELAFFLDPSIEIRLELASGEPGSLKLNSILQSIKSRVTDRRVLTTIAIALAAWFGAKITDYAAGEVLDMIFQQEEPGMSDEDKRDIAEQVVKLLQGEIAKPQVAQVYRELSTDTKIVGVGVTTDPERRPASIVPRQEFAQMMRTETDSVEPGEQRVIESEETATLISPVLVPGHRRWRLSVRDVEFGAPILDDAFVESVLSGKQPVPMMAGVTMRIVLQTKEEFVDGTWATKERAVLKVLQIVPAPTQGKLPLSQP